MTDERPRHSHELGHFGELSTSRVITELMTNFSADTPIQEVLEWIHLRLSLLEGSQHTATAFGMNAEYFQPTFGINAVTTEGFEDAFTAEARFPQDPIDPVFISAGAWLTGNVMLDAAVKGIGKTGGYYHYDDMSNQQDHGWGDGSHYGSYSYDGGTETDGVHKWRHLKADRDTDPLDEVYDYQGTLVEIENTNPYTWLHDDGLTNKRVLINISIGVCNNIWSCFQRFHFRGLNNYVQWDNEARGHKHHLIVDGATVYTAATTVTGWRWLKIEALDHVVRFKHWTGSEPEAWAYEHMTATPTAGPTGINWRGRSGGVITYVNQGSPWTHRLRHVSVTGINSGSIGAGAYIRPAPFDAAAWLSSGDDIVISAFIQPTFRFDALLVNYVPGNLTIGAFKKDIVPGDLTAGAFVQPYANMQAVINDDSVMGNHTADAWKVLTTEDSVGIDAVLHDTDRTYSVTADGIIHAQDLPGSYTADAYKNVLVTDDTTVDSFIAPGAHPPVDAIVKDLDREYSFSEGAWLWPQGIEHFEINAIKHQPDSDTSTVGLDAAIDYVGERLEHPHYDDFNRGASDNDAVGWGVPSHSGAYSYSDAATTRWLPAPTAGGENFGYWNVSTGDRVTYAREPLDLDRTMSLDMYIEYGAGIKIGNIYFFINDSVRVRKYHSNGGHFYLEVYYGGVWNGLTDNSAGADYDWKSLKVELVGTNIKYKVWDRSGSEPAWQYDASPPWTPTTGQPRIYHAGQSWFGSGGEPWLQRFDNWFVTGIGFPFSYNVNAVLRTVDNEGSVSAGAHIVPEPFTASAFIQPWFHMDARIWLGTTFDAGAMIQTIENVVDSEMTYTHVVGYVGGGTTTPRTWTHTLANGKAIVVTSRSRNAPDAVSYGNKPLTYRGGQIWTLDDIHNRDDDVVRCTGTMDDVYLTSTIIACGNPVSFADYDSQSLGGAGNKILTLQDTVPGPAWRMSINSFHGSKNPSGHVAYNEDPTGFLLSVGTPDGGIITGFGGAVAGNIQGPDDTDTTSGVIDNNGSFSEHYAVLMQAASEAILTDAFIRPGGHIPFSAQLTGKNLSAIIRAHMPTKTFTAEAARHLFGEQLKSYFADSVVTLGDYGREDTQLGRLYLGELMWGNVWPEREQGHFSAGAEIYSSYTESDFFADGRMKMQPVAVLSDAIKLATQEFGGSGQPEHTSITHGPSTSSRTWTHVLPTGGSAIFVTIANNNDNGSAVTYGNLALTLQYRQAPNGRMTEVWTRTSVNGRDDDVVRITGVGSTNTYMTSTIIANVHDVTVDAVSGPTGWAAWSTGNYTFTNADAKVPAAHRFTLNIAGGEDSDYYAQGMRPYQGDGVGHWVGGAGTANSSGSGIALNIDGPDTTTSTAGFTLTGSNGARYHGAVMMSGIANLTGNAGLGTNAYIAQYFGIEAMKHQEFINTVEAFAYIAQHMDLNAYIAQHFDINAIKRVGDNVPTVQPTAKAEIDQGHVWANARIVSDVPYTWFYENRGIHAPDEGPKVNPALTLWRNFT
jgi:hypothetical protein